MILKELIEYLEHKPPNTLVSHGFNNPHAYRGSYEDLAFEPTENTTVGEMLKCAKKALGTTYMGWKGGKFKMGGHVDVYIAEWGDVGDGIGKLLLDHMTAE